MLIGFECKECGKDVNLSYRVCECGSTDLEPIYSMECRACGCEFEGKSHDVCPYCESDNVLKSAIYIGA